MPRITYLLSQYPTQNHTYLLREVTGLRRLGWDVSVISLRTPDRAPDAMSVDERAEAQRTRYVLTGWGGVVARALGAAVRRPVGAVRVMAAAVRLAPSVRAVPAWVAYALEALVVDRMVPADEHVHLHFCMQVGVLLDVLRPGRWSLTVHGPAEFDGERGPQLAVAVHRAAMVRTISSFGRAMCLMRAPEVDPAKVVVNRLGLFGEEREARPPRNASDRFTFVNVGRLSVEKGLGILLNAFAAATAGGLAARLLLVGGGPMERELRARVRELGLDDAVEFTGWVRPDQVPEHLASADAMVSASFAEGIPLALMEAMSQGLPCIATAVGGVPELVENGHTGLLVPAGDEEALATALLRLAEDASLRTAATVAGRAVVEERHDLDINVPALAGLLARHATSVAEAIGRRSVLTIQPEITGQR